MTKITFAILPIFLTFSACTNAPKNPERIHEMTYATDDATWIKLDSTGKILFGGKIVQMDELTNRLVDSMRSIKKIGGSLPTQIIYKLDGDVPMNTRGGVKESINEALEIMKKETPQ